MKRFLTNWMVCSVLFAIPALPTCAQWVQTNGPEGGYYITFAKSENNLFAATLHTIYHSANNGATWTEAGSGIPDTTIQDLAVCNGIVFAGTHKGIFMSTNNGTIWTGANTGLTNTIVRTLTVNGRTIFAGTAGGIFYSTNNGAAWLAIDSQETEIYIQELVPLDTVSIAAACIQPNRLLIISKNGDLWKIDTAHVPSNKVLLSFAADNNNLFMGIWDTLYFSNNRGDGWLPIITHLPKGNVVSLEKNGDTLFAEIEKNGVFSSFDNGTSWTGINSGLTDKNVNALKVFGSTLLVGAQSGIFISTNSGATWAAANSGTASSKVRSLAVNGNKIYALTSGNTIFHSSDNGKNWDPVHSQPDTYLYDIATSGNEVFALYGYSVLRSTDNGANWLEIFSDSSQFIRTLVQSNAALFIGTNNGISRSIDNGATWAAVFSGWSVTSLAASDNTVFAGTRNGIIFHSTDNGVTWKKLYQEPDENFIKALLVKGNTLLTSISLKGILRLAYNGTGWDTLVTKFDVAAPDAFTKNSTNVFALSSNAIFYSPDAGINWSEIDFDHNGQTLLSLAVNDETIYVGVNCGGVWRRPHSEVASVPRGKLPMIPHMGSVMRINSSGTMNQDITVSFQLPHQERVVITVYTPAGREIATLINKHLDAGLYSYRWNTLYSTPGCYLVRMQTGSGSCLKSLPVFR